MITNKKQMEMLFDEIDSKAKTPIHIYIIGGGAMLYAGLKQFTKDIDAVVKTKKEYDEIHSVLKGMGFKETALTDGIQRLAVSAVLEKGEARMDLFFEKICGKMNLSNPMASRAKKIYSGKHLTASTCSNEDILLFKSITDRPGDKQDSGELIRYGLNWETVLEELLAQIKSGEQVWVTYINERLLELEEKGFNIPIMNQLEEKTAEYYKELEKKLSKK